VHHSDETALIEEARQEREVGLPPDRQNSRKPLSEKLKASIARFFKQFRIIRRALVHPKVPWYAKAVAGCAVLYVISPIQLIPNFIPILGQLDDVLVVSLAMKFLRRSVPPSILEECEKVSPAPIESATTVTPLPTPVTNSRP
jgi:uncharacterized membrane protein YkvA (DUF1232 family)